MNTHPSRTYKYLLFTHPSMVPTTLHDNTFNENRIITSYSNTPNPFTAVVTNPLIKLDSVFKTVNVFPWYANPGIAV